MKIDKRLAVVKTGTISIKMMTLADRKLTMAVFRQIPEKSVFVEKDETGKLELVGECWGVVRYVWSKCPQWTQYHVVWEQNNILYRTPMPAMKEVKKNNEYYHDYQWGEFERAHDVREMEEIRKTKWCHSMMALLKQFEKLDQLFIATG